MDNTKFYIGANEITREEYFALEADANGWREFKGVKTRIADTAVIGDGAEIGNGFPSLNITGKWQIHPYAPGKVRCGCYIGYYANILSRTPTEWKEKGYNAQQRKLAVSFITYLRDNEQFWFGDRK